MVLSGYSYDEQRKSITIDSRLLILAAIKFLVN